MVIKVVNCNGEEEEKGGRGDNREVKRAGAHPHTH